jgi:predicted MFS family arabinose efflux permease
MRELRRPGWLTTPILAVSGLSIGSGIAQFGVTAVIGDVAATFGAVGVGSDLTAQIGLPTTTVGLALALIRLTSLAALPVASIADQRGRQRVLVGLSVVGLGLTVLAALAPGFWWYVALVALARPALSGVNAVTGVVASEETRTKDRSAAIALVTAAYGLGAGLIVVGRAALGGLATFRVVTAAAVIPLVLMPLIVRGTREPRIARDRLQQHGMLGSVPRAYVRSVALLSILSGLIALATGPAFSYLFVYGERVLGMSPGLLALLVVLAGPAGLVGILLGRATADRIGRNLAAGVSMAGTGAAVAWAYGGTSPRLAIGYLLAITASSAFAPPTGALGAELVPTRIRATLAGWVTFAGVLGAVIGIAGFGVLADATGGFDSAARTIGIVTAVTAAGFLLLPETRGLELEDLEEPTV